MATTSSFLHPVALVVLTVLAVADSPIVRRGTIIVLKMSNNQDYVTVAADSWTGDGSGHFVDNKSCKVISLGGDTLFFETGNARIQVPGRPRWDAKKLARTVYTESKQRNVQSLSNAWAKRAVKWFGSEPNTTLKNWSEAGGLVLGAFVNFKGSWVVESQTITYSEDEHRVTAILNSAPEPGRLRQPFGTPENFALATEFLRATSFRALLAWGPLREPVNTDDVNIDTLVVTKAVQFVIDHSNTAAGPIDVALLKRGSPVQWISRKGGCESEDVR